jgi:hypothetical protein
MSKLKSSKNVSSNEKKKRKEWPVVVYFWTFGLGALGYILGGIATLAALVSLDDRYYWCYGRYADRLDLVSLAWRYYLIMEER